MRLAIMQPYFLPYIGYFQLMTAVDKFILLDDVNFINRGWINRNRIAVSGEPHWLTLPLVKASQNRLINEIEIVDDETWKTKTMRMLETSYAGAPFAREILPIFSKLLTEAKGRLSPFLYHSLSELADYIGIEVKIEPTSAMYPKGGQSGAARILDICRKEGATAYLNLSGGRELYNLEMFAAHDIELLFLDPNLTALSLRHGGREGPSLSILDLLLFNSATAIREATRMSCVSPA